MIQASTCVYAFVAFVAHGSLAEAQSGGTIGDLEQPAIEVSDVRLARQIEPPLDRCCVEEAEDDLALGTAIRQAIAFTTFQHVTRLREHRTRSQLDGPFLRDWFTSVKHLGTDWDDGGKFFTNYIAHPMGGAVYANIYRQNDGGRRDLLVGEPGYAGMLARAMLFSAVVSAQFELGPLSEASIGNVGLVDPKRMAWGDLLITPALGTAWMVAEDLVDQRVLDGMEGKNVVLRNVLRLMLNPSRSGANMSRGKLPWYRERDVTRR